METATATAKLLLKPEEAARALGIGRTRMYKLLRCGEVHSVLIGRSRRVRPEDLKQYVARLAGQSDLGEEASVR